MRNVMLISVVLLFAGVCCFGRTITVALDGSGEFSTIQAGIDAAIDGDEVVLANGLYTGNGNRDIEFRGKAIVVRSANGPGNCIIDCKASETNPHRGFNFHGAEQEDSVLDGVTITNGYASLGGGIYCGHYSSSGTSSPTIKHCIIRNNRAVNGGGVYFTGGTVGMIDCLLEGNAAKKSGGGLLCDTSKGVLTRCSFKNNSALLSGGGMMFWNTGFEMQECSFFDNKAGERGGGVACDGSLKAARCVFVGNHSENAGGGISAIGGDSIVNCLFVGNTAVKHGGGIVCFGYHSVVNCTFLQNQAPAGNAVCCYHAYGQGGSLNIVNSILINYSPEISNLNRSLVSVSFSDVRGGWEGKGNIDVNPEFVYQGGDDAALWDLRLCLGSPCIDTGDPRYVPEEGEMDLGGRPRVDDGNGDGIAVVDMGAYEVQAPRTLYVPQEYRTIQAAIDAADNRDTVVVAPGRYVESIAFGGKNIVVTSTDPWDWGTVEDTSIDADGADHVVVFDGSEGAACRLEGFTLTGGCADNASVPGTVGERGGAIMGAGALGDPTKATVSRCIMRNNVSTRTGSAVWNFAGEISNCRIEANHTDASGALALCSGPILNCILAGNTTGVTPSGVFHNCDGRIINCTIANNFDAAHPGAAFYGCDGVDSIIANCIIWGNALGPAGEFDVSPNHMCCSTQETDPLFVNAAGGDYRVFAWSPCVDAGTDAVPGGLPETDINSLARVMDGNRDGVAVVDIGACEAMPNTAPVADAGADIEAFAWIDGVAEVLLDGSGSCDADGDMLACRWLLDGVEIGAGEALTVGLEVGEHVIVLEVSDGWEVSTDEVAVRVVGAMEADVRFAPRVINVASQGRGVLAVMRLPAGVEAGDMDAAWGVVLEPGGAAARLWRFLGGKGQGGVFAMFDGDAVIGALGESGFVDVSVVCRLGSGRYVYGTDRVRVIDNGHGPKKALRAVVPVVRAVSRDRK
ncbi:MAG: hypothetical protein IH624_10520 [Phycisphaerae bacterium]|nr:hypothetical protein [Phycisphaerae bacterium]